VTEPIGTRSLTAAVSLIRGASRASIVNWPLAVQSVLPGGRLGGAFSVQNSGGISLFVRSIPT